MTTDFGALILKQMPEAVIVMSMEGIVAYWSDNAQATFGYTADEAVGRSIFDLIAPTSHWEEELQQLKNFAAAGVGNHESIRRKKMASRSTSKCPASWSMTRRARQNLSIQVQQTSHKIKHYAMPS